MPKPPNALGVQMESQALRDRFFDFLEGKPHQKFLKILLSYLQQQFGIKKELIA